MTDQTIKSVREELINKTKKFIEIKNTYHEDINEYHECRRASIKLKGFNLGVELAQKEFLDWLYDFQTALTFNGANKDIFNSLESKQKILKENLGVK